MIKEITAKEINPERFVDEKVEEIRPAETLAREIILAVPGIVSVTYNIAPKPPSTIEAV